MSLLVNGTDDAGVAHELEVWAIKDGKVRAEVHLGILRKEPVIVLDEHPTG